jgi:type IV pilus assembly protein PilB
MALRRWKKLGEILIAQNLITSRQLAQGLEEHRRTGVSLGTVLVNLGHISQDDLTGVLGEQIQLKQRKPLGEILVEHGLMSPTQVEEGLAEQKRTGDQLGKCITRLGLLTEERLVGVLAAQMDVQHVVLEHFVFDRALLKTIPEEMLRQYGVMPLYESNGVLTMAMSDPTNLRVIDILKFKTGKEIEPVIASEKSIQSAIERNYSGNIERMTELLQEAENHELDVVKEIEDSERLTVEEGAQVVKIVNAIVTQAIMERASDIHLEPLVNHVRLRYRIDGQLAERNPIPLALRAQITSRLKIMAGMDISERRRPQDGRFQVRHEARMIDIRVSTFPTITRSRGVNEKIVLRILDPDSGKLQLEDLGFHPDMLRQFEELIRRPNGIILVTGPTGSGKSSTLYSALQRIHEISRNIITMEDPVEYYIDGISQAQINPRAGFSFAEGMRAILRQDPDVIMVGEMRDRETSEMAIQAALTGHLVFSTLHTNDAVTAFTRLMDMRIEPYLLTSTIIGVLAQRLMRRLCDRCKQEEEPAPEVLERLGLPPGTKLQVTQGCRNCKNTGYNGRIGAFELLVPDEEVYQLVLRRSGSDEIRHHLQRRGGYRILRDDGLDKALQGLTTLEQVLATTPEN